MCGICGFLKLNNTNYINKQYVIDMNEEMIHRGPDGGNIWMSDNNLIAFGHRRLSIIDLSTNASQPMANSNNDIVLTYNGEIYNHSDIRKELEAKGKYKWITDHSDTEVILRAYEEWGIECIHRFRGMFAFAIWDKRINKAYLVRDRIGIKPLFYTVNNGILTFSSDINSLLKVLSQKPKINEKAMYDYLTFLCATGEDTMFKEIHKVKPATYLEIDVTTGTIKKKKYWDVLDNYQENIYTASENEIIEALMSEIKVSADLRKASDVPVGIFLSGGVDSSTNAVLFAKNEKKPIHTFSVGYDKHYEGCSSEIEYARMIANKIGSIHHEIIMDEEKTLSFLDDLIRYQGEPLADPVCIPVYYLSKLARDNGVYVCQVGEGADELLGGYEKWIPLIDNKENKYSPYNNTILCNIAVRLLGNTRYKYSEKYNIMTKTAKNEPFYWSHKEVFSETSKHCLLNEAFIKSLDGYSTVNVVNEYLSYYKEHAINPSAINWMTYSELNIRLPDLLLARVDRMSMAASIECRVPFLDHKIVELCMSIPQKLKIKNSIPKYLLKKGAERIIPREIIYRKKQGFGLPVHCWIDSHLGKEMETTISKFAYESGYLNHKTLNSNLNNPRLFSGMHKWYLYNLAAWWEKTLY